MLVPILTEAGTVNPKIVGQSATTIASMAGIKNVKENAKVLIGEQKTVDRFDISPLTDNDYCIAGSEIGRKHVVDIIKRLSEAASSQEIMAPVYLTDGTQEVLMNEDIFRKNHNILPASKEELDHKYTIIENIITEEKGKTLYKAA